MQRALIVGFALLSLVGCAGSEPSEDQGDSTSNLVQIPGKGRLSVTVATTKADKGVVAHVTLKCGTVAGRDDLAGDGDAEGILFPIVRPEDCTIVVTVKGAKATDKDTAITLRNPGKAQFDTVLTGTADGYTATATFGEPITQ